MSINAWEHALKCLPESASECTPVELRLKDQCHKGLEAVFRDKAKAIEDGKSGKNVASIPHSVTANGDMPWQRALSMLNEMKHSSVRTLVFHFCQSNAKSAAPFHTYQGWVILNAYRVRIQSCAKLMERCQLTSGISRISPRVLQRCRLLKLPMIASREPQT